LFALAAFIRTRRLFLQTVAVFVRTAAFVDSDKLSNAAGLQDSLHGA
jgi:hypothetical protein